jgi:ParB family chromosome partitioning protein
MSKRDMLMQGVANVRESMGDFGDAVRGAPTLGPRALPAHLQGVVRSKDVSLIELDRIVRDPDQPREEFEAEALDRLAQSLRSRGQLQPIRVRWAEEQGAYVIVCGERRWRAARMAGMASLACVIVDGPLAQDELLAVQLVENAVREDLRPIEQAGAYRRLMEAKGWSARQLAGELAIHHAQVVRALALLELPEAVQHQVEQGALAPATAYEIGKLPEPTMQAEVARAAVQEGLKRSEVAELVQAVKARRPAPATRPDPVIFDLGDGLSITIRWKKANGVDLVKALRLALKLAQERGRDDQTA